MMTRLARRPEGRNLLASALGLGLFSAPLSFAQLPSIELHSIHPPILKAGTTTEISLTGAHLDELSGLQFSIPNLRAEPILLPKTEFRPDPGQNGTCFRVTVPAEAPPGLIEVRAVGLFGVSPSRPLLIAGSGEKILADTAGTAHHQLSTAPLLEKEARAHGTTDANQVDWWKIELRKGERILVHCYAERIDSQADATLRLVNESSQGLESSRDFIGRDPMIDFTAPEDGAYWVGVHDFLYLGGTNFPYLLQVSQRPWIDAVFPPAGQQAQVLEATLFGRLLPGSQQSDQVASDGKLLESLGVSIPVPATASTAEFRWEPPAQLLLSDFAFSHANSPPVRIGISSLPVSAVLETDAEPDAETPFSPPCEIVARFDEEGDSDRFRFRAIKGQTYYLEVMGNRISERIDPYLVVEKVTKDDKGAETFSPVRENDDQNGQGGAGFPDRSMDPTVSFVADQDGDYRVTVINQFGYGGPDATYRLAIREARPDFDIVAVSERPYLEQRQAFPAAPFLRQGGTFPLRVLVYRKDGFEGPVTITASGLPEGVSCPPVTARNKETSVTLALAATPDAPSWSGVISLTAKARIGEAEVTRPVRVGTLVSGVADSNTARLRSRLEVNLPLSVCSSEKTPARIESPGDGRFSVTLGEKLEIPVKVSIRNATKGNLVITPVALRGLVKPPSLTLNDKTNEGKLTLDFKPQNNVFTPEAGTWNFVLKATGVSPYRKNPESATRAKEEQTRIDALAKQYSDAAGKARGALDAAKKGVEEIQKQLTTVTPEARPDVERRLAEAQEKAKIAQAAFDQAEAKRVEAEKEKAAAAKRSTEANQSAAAKDVKFAAWSLPLTVEVKEAPKKPETK